MIHYDRALAKCVTPTILLQRHEVKEANE